MSRTEWSQAVEQAGSFSKKILELFRPHLGFDRRHTLVDIQVMFLRKGQFTTNREGAAWHTDGTTAVHLVLTKFLGGGDRAGGMLDFDDTLNRTRKMRFFSYFVGETSRTEYVENSITVRAPKCIGSFGELSEMVNILSPAIYTQKPLDLMGFDDTVLHRAAPAQCDGWRYWVRIGEIDFYPRPRSRHIDTAYGAI